MRNKITGEKHACRAGIDQTVAQEILCASAVRIIIMITLFVGWNLSTSGDHLISRAS